MTNAPPLSEQLRPNKLANFFGQTHLLAPQSPLRLALENGRIHSMILWGPSGSGKTTLANLISQIVDGHFMQLSATSDGVKALRKVIEVAKSYEKINQQFILFVDEVHRFNKAQQDVLLPHIESGLLIFIGATTQNPAFEINQALLSRLAVHVFEKLKIEALDKIFKKAITRTDITMTSQAKKSLLAMANGDARRLLNTIELLQTTTKNPIKLTDLKSILSHQIGQFDKGGDVFYQQLSAFHKSVRGCCPDGALYWFSRMITAGCDAKIIARRLLAIASEDIGNADPRALEICLNAWDIYHRVGDKEGHRAIAQAIIYCAVASKSNAVYLAFNTAMAQAKQTSDLPVPKHLCNGSDSLSKALGVGEGYQYAHDQKNAYASGQTYFPDELGEQTYYVPNSRGLEQKITQRLKQYQQWDKQNQ